MKFSISRIHTRFGIFRVVGEVEFSAQSDEFMYEKVEFMGTDGWCDMDLESPHTQTVLSNIQADFINHLQAMP
ncbi:MAG: hypothetical protein JJU03_00295 [Idiomarina sp.]|nr:hypothetical protein [Idiomarina sp.]